MSQDFAGRTVLVTGATSGIGRATARLLNDNGATVVATGRNAEALAELGDVLAIPGDLTDETFRERLVEFATEAGRGRLHALVNAAGIIGTGSIESATLDSFDNMMDINVRSVFDLTHRCTELLKAAKGSIVNVSSVTGTRAFPGVLSYCVSKAAIDQMTRCIALELAEHGVRCNAVNPGVVRTSLHRNGGMGEEDYAAFLERSAQTHPLGRIGEPEEVAELIAFLAGNRSGWITGECIAIDGGRAQTCAR
jgi:NAD(P)-dependent dehydrogenase (short-subunit alcohol dehydrogenase family)